MHITPDASAAPVHPSTKEQGIAVAIVVWVIFVGVCVVVANAWAADYFRFI